MRFLKFTLIVFSLVMVYNCNSKPEQDNSKIDKQEESSKKITSKDIENLKFTDYILSNAAKKITVDWQTYQELNSQTEFLKKADMAFFYRPKDTLKTFIKAFKAEVPKVINTNVVQARITALETNLLRLNSVLALSNISKEEQLENIKAYLIAMSNLNLQINKKLELDANNIEKQF